MFRKTLFLLTIILIPFIGKSQKDSVDAGKPEYKKYNWDSVPKLHQLSAEESKLGEVVIKDKRIIEYYYETPDNLVMYVTRHVIIRVNSEKAVENNNTVYIATGNGTTVLDIKARAITKNGKVTNLDPKNIKDVDNYDNQGPYKIFAIDGIEPGGEVEYLYTVEHPFRIYGTEYMRVNALHKDFEVDIYSPSNLIFKAKSYNGFPEMLTDTNLTTKHRLYMRAHDIKGYSDEAYSAEDGALMRMEYKFTYNTAEDPDKKLYTYNEFCQRLFGLLEESTDKKDKKTAEKVADTMRLSKLSDDDKIRKVESYVKNAITLREDVDGDQYRSLPFIFKNHVTDDIGMLKLYHMIFDAAGVKNEIVLTTNRFTKPFDSKFESWTYLQKYLIYFPSTGKYMAPTEILSRYGFPPADWICQQGLFIHSVTLGKFTSGYGEIKEISCNDYRDSKDNIAATVKFDLDAGNVDLHYKESYTGYEAYDIQPLYSFLSDEQKNDFVKNLFQAYFQDAKPTNIVVSGYKESDLFHNPFVVEADFSTNTVMEQAGNKYLFKIGLLIGPQEELYHDTARHTPIENHNNKWYHRELSFQIPDGYKITNLDAVNMNVSDGKKGDTTMEFISRYKIDGNKVTVIIDENYRQLRYPISMYDEFRKVINASADFNKVVLFLEKK